MDTDNIDITVNFNNLTFINGYTTPMPYSLLTVRYGAEVNIDNCEFINNSCLRGGAIAIDGGASVYIKNSKFNENKAILITSQAESIWVSDGYLYLDNCEFINNTACDGGAIHVGYSGYTDIINSRFINNTALNTTLVVGGGGAIYTKGNTNIINSTFINNYADLYGGAVYVAGGNTKILQSYFKDNKVGNAAPHQ